MKRAFNDFAKNQYLKRLESGPLQYPTIVSFSITLILLCIQLYFIKPYFLVNDDIYKILLVKGIGITSAPTPYFILSNVLLGLFFVKWYAWFPSVPLYSYLLCAVQFLSLWAFLWILCLKSTRWFHLFLFIVSCLGVQFIFFTYLQFTEAASMAAAVGILLFVFSTKTFPGCRPCAWIFSGVLLLFSWLIRPDSFLLVLLASTPLILFELWGASPRVIFKEQWKFVTAVALLMLLSSGFNFVWFQKHEDWKDFQRFALELQRTLEFQSCDYSPVTKPIFDSVGWSENDYWLFKDWYFMDPEKFSISNFEKFRAQFPRMGSEGKIGSFHSPMELFGSFWDKRILLYFFVFWAFCRGSAFRFLFIQLSWIALIFLFLIYFMKATDRVTLPLLAYLMNLAIFYAERPFSTDAQTGSTLSRFLPWPRIILLCAAFAFVFPQLKNYYLQDLEKQKLENQMKVCLKQLHPSEKQLYVMLQFPFEVFNVFDDFECLRPFRIFFSSVNERCPAAMNILKEFKVKDVFRDAVDNPNIFMICNQEEGLHYYTYLKENFHMTIYARKILDCGFLKVFSIHSRQES
jgi:hypothetical protein